MTTSPLTPSLIDQQRAVETGPHHSAAHGYTVATLDAGGSSFRFAALRGCQRVTPVFTLPTHNDDLQKCLDSLLEGFARVWEHCAETPAAISFGFPGPADYRAGVIWSPPNIPAFRGGVALGPFLEEQFRVPVFINNDADLFTYGEAMEGLLPHVNAMLKQAGSLRRYNNLIGITLGTGMGAGVTLGGRMLQGDNSAAAEIWSFRNKRLANRNVEAVVSIRGVQETYRRFAGLQGPDTLDPREIASIACGTAAGDRAAAQATYELFGEVTGDAIAHVLSIVDGLIVLGGGLSLASEHFLPSVLAELNGSYADRPRGIHRAFNLEDPDECSHFLNTEDRVIPIPRSSHCVTVPVGIRTAIGRSRLGTTEAIMRGAYRYADTSLREREFRRANQGGPATGIPPAT